MLKLVTPALFLAALTLFQTQPGRVINGRLFDSAGKAARGVQVCAFESEFDQRKPGVFIPCGWSDAEGRFSIYARKAGRYKLFYNHPAGGYWSQYLPYFRHPTAGVPEVLLDDYAVSASVTITMAPKNGLLVGKSIDTVTGLPVENVQFALCHAADPGACWVVSVKNSEGVFTLPAPHVPFTVRARSNGFEDWLGPDGGEKAAPISVAAETKTEMTVFMKRAAASAGRALSEAEKRPGVNLPAPAQLSPAEGAVFNHYPRLTRLEWAPVEGAASYTVELDYCAGDRGNKPICVNPQPLALPINPPPSGLTGTAYEFTFLGAQPGRWRVWAVDAGGREGFKSHWRRFVYLR